MARRLGAASAYYDYEVRACAGSGTTRQCSPWTGSVAICVGAPGGLNELTRQTSYVHTDGLRSVVAETDGTGLVTERRRYEPYGAPTSGSYVQGPGYAGHVMDAATRLVYMQQRYYDPIAGRFLSGDPVTGTPVGRQQSYEVPAPGGGTDNKSVQVSRDTRGEHAGMPQIEAGTIKPGGQPDIAGRPRIQNVDKVRVDFDPKR